jgi:hypothetical protein
LYQSKIGISIVVMSLSISAYVSESEYGKNNTNPSDTCINEDMFSKQPINEERYPLVKLLENETSKEEIVNDYDEVVKIPIVKTVKVRFGKPRKKEFSI